MRSGVGSDPGAERVPFRGGGFVITAAVVHKVFVVTAVEQVGGVGGAVCLQAVIMQELPGKSLATETRHARFVPAETVDINALAQYFLHHLFSGEDIFFPVGGQLLFCQRQFAVLVHQIAVVGDAADGIEKRGSIQTTFLVDRDLAAEDFILFLRFPAVAHGAGGADHGVQHIVALQVLVVRTQTGFGCLPVFPVAQQIASQV